MEIDESKTLSLTISAGTFEDSERGNFATEIGVGMSVVAKTPVTAFGRASADPKRCHSAIRRPKMYDSYQSESFLALPN